MPPVQNQLLEALPIAALARILPKLTLVPLEVPKELYRPMFGKDSVVLFQYRSELLLFIQSGDNVVLTAGGNPVAAFLNADADEVAASILTLTGFLENYLIA